MPELKIRCSENARHHITTQRTPVGGKFHGNFRKMKNVKILLFDVFWDYMNTYDIAQKT